MQDKYWLHLQSPDVIGAKSGIKTITKLSNLHLYKNLRYLFRRISGPKRWSKVGWRKGKPHMEMDNGVKRTLRARPKYSKC